MYRTNGRTMSRYLRTAPQGGEPNGTTGGGGAGTQPAPAPTADDQLGDAGKKALTEERKQRGAAEKRAAALEAELQQLRDANKSAEEKALDAARREGANTATTAANARLVSAEVRIAAASGGFADPGDALAALREQLSAVKVTDTGEVDQAAVKQLVDELAKAKPYLLKQSTTGTASPADAGIGAGGTTSGAPVAPGLGRLSAAYAAGAKK
ncbi:MULTISPECIES: hypothetical protein [Actinosynnema]|uniref:Scaffolding protein n=1 Tax=Actinosynnema pretiosum TaxID=42197 RepID=A0A290ZAU7_9PSEU|nr:hypothetical protein [Actinosynnema pretiosum]ATE56151.1 hypothetical protein CNX65_25115 [Actinosynnema pretiosum]MCP2098601.1 hypothetical protein [Actinosynnema pretiosum]